MSLRDGSEPIDDDEILYRRIPDSQGWYNPQIDPPLSPEAFNPRSADVTGLSVSRARYETSEQAAQGWQGKTYYVAVLHAADLCAHGIGVIPRPLKDNPGHAEIPALTYDNRKSDRSKEIKICLAHELTVQVLGPFIAAAKAKD